MKWWIKFGCFLTGWNSKILAQCSEASYKHLKKYTSALLILIILWGFTGFCFAQRYVGAPLWGCVLSALIFIVIVIQIERQIILTVGTNGWGTFFRFFIALIMSFLGSTILDQIIFGNDIDRKMIEITDRQVQEQLPMRLNVIDERIKDLQVEINSLKSVSDVLNKEIAEEGPVVKTVSTVTVYRNERQEDGTYIKVPETTVSTVLIPNPKIEQRNRNDSIVRARTILKDEWSDKKINVENDLRTELSSNMGFLEELRAMLEIIFTRWEAGLFYAVIIFFLTSLELFVVTSKLGDKKCDYDLIVEHQLDIKKAALEELVKNLNQKK